MYKDIAILRLLRHCATDLILKGFFFNIAPLIAPVVAQ